MRRVVRTFNTKVTLRYLSTLLVAIPLVIPYTNGFAADSPGTDVVIEARLKGLTAGIVDVQSKKVSLPVVKAAEKPVTPKVTVQPVVVVYRAVEADPGAAVKRTWVKKAASAYGIDWKILEAVWMVESGKRWHTTIRSYAGAQGPCQFMPGTWRGYAQDGNGDGIKDVTYAPDCLFGAARLLAANGAASGQVVNALLRYNHSMSYVNHVLAIARTY